MNQKANLIGWRPIEKGDIDAKYEQALAELKQMPSEGLDQAFEPLLSDSTMKRILGGKEKVTDATKLKLIYAIDAPKLDKLYDAISQRVQHARDKEKIIDSYLGTYCYFTKYYQNNNHKLILVKGKIEILIDGDGNPCFYHWSHNWRNSEPEHVGFVFLSDSRIFLVATKTGVIRLTTIRTATDPIEYMIGFTLGVRSSGNFEPFSSKIIMFSSKNRELLNKLKGNEEYFRDLLDCDECDYLRM